MKPQDPQGKPKKKPSRSKSLDELLGRKPSKNKAPAPKKAPLKGPALEAKKKFDQKISTAKKPVQVRFGKNLSRADAAKKAAKRKKAMNTKVPKRRKK